MSTPAGQCGFLWLEWRDGGDDWEPISVAAPDCLRISAAFLEEEEAKGENWNRQEYLFGSWEREGRVFSEESIDAMAQDFEALEI